MQLELAQIVEAEAAELSGGEEALAKQPKHLALEQMLTLQTSDKLGGHQDPGVVPGVGVPPEADPGAQEGPGALAVAILVSAEVPAGNQAMLVEAVALAETVVSPGTPMASPKVMTLTLGQLRSLGKQAKGLTSSNPA